ncbi:MAG: M20/M25/M40 family metallo-hydrolase [Verrucomicrobiales bacterium]|nr:M20/M25/M40 family metallo-hydrolase [Verrucomicrobiales bacterium]
MADGADGKRKGSRERVISHRDALHGVRELVLANVVMAAEIPAPTGSEKRVTRFLSERFTEAGLTDIASDQAGNIAGVIPGRNRQRNLLVAAHVDKIWTDADDHTVSVEVGCMKGRGIADNSLGVAVLATLPLILERLGIELDSNLILLGTTRSFGRGDLAGMRFFLENVDQAIAGALCLEGIELGRLSYASPGMARGEIRVEICGEGEDFGSAGAIFLLNQILNELLKLNEAHAPEATILIGTVDAESGYNVPPLNGEIRFEIRGESEALVKELEEKIGELVENVAGQDGDVFATLEIIAHRKPGDLGSDHMLVRAAREIQEVLGIAAKIEPSISEVAALLESGIPGLTLGITDGGSRHTRHETVQLERIPEGLAQIVSVIEFMDAELPDKATS